MLQEQSVSLIFFHQPSGRFQVHVAQTRETTFLWAGLRGLARSKTEAEKRKRREIRGREERGERVKYERERGTCERTRRTGRRGRTGYVLRDTVVKNNNPQQHEAGVRGDSQRGHFCLSFRLL